MSVMAMIYFVFVSVNALTYYAMTTIQTFLAIILRLSSIFEMEEFDFKREISVSGDQVLVKFVNADLSWGYKVKELAVADSKNG